MKRLTTAELIYILVGALFCLGIVAYNFVIYR